jgi:hypothetical protein
MIGAVGLSYAAGQTAGGYSGSAAYTWIQNAIGPTNLALQNDNPMWAIVPRVAIPVQPPSCDLDGNGTVDNNDVQISISRAEMKDSTPIGGPYQGTLAAGSASANASAIPRWASSDQARSSWALGQGFCGGGDLDGDGKCTVIDTQRIINVVSGGASCRIGP